MLNYFFKLCLILYFLTFLQNIKAQDVYPIALGTSGILTGKYKIDVYASDAISINSVPDTISIADAKEIFAINAVQVNNNKSISKVNVIEFQLSIVENGNINTIKGNSSFLSAKMKTALKEIKPGTIIHFEGIKVEFPKGERSSIIMLSLIVI